MGENVALVFEGWTFPTSANPYLGIPHASASNEECAQWFVDRIEREYEHLKDWLPTELNIVLDIGCGLAGVDVLLARNAGVKVFHLMDGRGEPKTVRGFSPCMTAWTDVEVAAEVLAANVDCKIYVHHPDPTLMIPADLIYSGASWGHHYPIDIYGELAVRCLNERGRIILDVRKKSDGVVRMEAFGFQLLGVIDNTKIKRTRYAFARVA